MLHPFDRTAISVWCCVWIYDRHKRFIYLLIISISRLIATTQIQGLPNQPQPITCTLTKAAPLSYGIYYYFGGFGPSFQMWQSLSLILIYYPKNMVVWGILYDGFLYQAHYLHPSLGHTFFRVVFSKSLIWFKNEMALLLTCGII